MSIKDHAMSEFRAAGWVDESGNYCDPMQKMVCEALLELLDVFAKQGHSGFSASYTRNAFNKLANLEPLAPLTGEEWEWVEVCEGTFQNRRDGRVFKDASRFDGQPYFIEGIVFYDVVKDKDGEEFKSHFTCGDSHVPITFPYTPKTEYRERKE